MVSGRRTELRATSLTISKEVKPLSEQAVRVSNELRPD